MTSNRGLELRDMTTAYRLLPSVERLLSDESIALLIEEHSRPVVLELVRQELNHARSGIKSGNAAPRQDEIIAAISDRAESLARDWPRHVINATGVVLHTNLGRSPLSKDAIQAMQRAAQGYSDLELDLLTGRRGSRQAHISNLVAQVTGAEAALVVNNNASAVMLGLATLAEGKEVIVSRGEAVEIGGGFRIPDVLEQSGATLVEVGTTNRTYAEDYANAINPKTGALLAVHASNFRVVGFTHAPQIRELAQIGQRFDLPVLHDLGSGCLIDTTRFGMAHEPMPQEDVSAGVGLSFFSGDKLLGGPQAGIIAGKKTLVDMVAHHPLARAMRIDKLSMAALAATLEHYIRDEPLDQVPVWQMIARNSEAVRARVEGWANRINGPVSVAESLSTIGGGSLPGETLSSWALAIQCGGLYGGAEGLARRLRKSDTHILGRIEDERVLMDGRTVLSEEDDALLTAVQLALDAGEQLHRDRLK